MIEGALKADGRIAAKNAVKIRAALHQVADFKRVFNKYQETQPQPTDNPAQDRTRARSWLILNVYFNDEPLRQTVMRAWAEAYVLGQVAADEWLRKTREANKAADDIEVNWDNWKPGDKATALLLNPTKGFEAYLQSTGGASYFKKFNKETIVNLGTALSDSIAAGLDAESAAVMIGKHVASPSRALTIAITEQNRAMSFSSIERYKEAGLAKMEWAVSDPCDTCAKNDGQVIVIGQTFASGHAQPPAHPHCRCVLLPVVPGMEDEFAMPGAEITPMPDEMAYVGNAPQASPVMEVSNQTDVLPGATARNKQIEEQIEEFKAALGKDISDERLLDALNANGAQGEIDNTDIYWPLKKKFESMGFSPDEAGMQVRGVLLRTESYIENKRLQGFVARQLDEWEAPVAARYRERLKIVEQRLLDAMKNGDVTIAVDKDVLMKIFEDGKFKNQFDTKKSGGLLDFSRRKTAEKAVFDIDVNIPNQQRPIYGYITDNLTKLDFGLATNTEEWLDTILSIRNSRTSQYGSIKVVLKDSVKNRATATIGDSLGRNMIGDNLLEVKPDLSNMGLYRYGAPTGNVGLPDFSYLETQIKGGVTLDDVEAIYLPYKSGDNEFAAKTVQQIEELIKASGRDIKIIEMGAGE
jgi:SPP1 gp7 family putative phage head morphogenesis protein